jgi:hypothetical protein
MSDSAQFAASEGRFECRECDWWVPAGMEYLAEEHDC